MEGCAGTPSKQFAGNSSVTVMQTCRRGEENGSAARRGSAGGQFLNHSNHLCPLIGHHAASLPGMDSSPTMPTQLEEKRRSGPSEVAEQALVPLSPAVETEMLVPPQSLAARLPVEVEVGIPVKGFRVRNLLALALGVVVESEWGQGDDMPLAAGDVQLAWSEFEVIDTQLAVRLTRSGVETAGYGTKERTRDDDDIKYAASNPRKKGAWRHGCWEDCAARRGPARAWPCWSGSRWRRASRWPWSKPRGADSWWPHRPRGRRHFMRWMKVPEPCLASRIPGRTRVSW